MGSPNSRNEGYTQLRLRDETHARLLSLQRALTARRDADRRRAGLPVGLAPLSLSDVVSTLLFRYDCHLARGRENQRKRKEKRCRS